MTCTFNTGGMFLLAWVLLQLAGFAFFAWLLWPAPAEGDKKGGQHAE